MRELINKLYTVLNLIKDFDVGYGEDRKDQMIIDYKGKRYMITFTELCDTEYETMLCTMKRYWR